MSTVCQQNKAGQGKRGCPSTEVLCHMCSIYEEQVTQLCPWAWESTIQEKWWQNAEITSQDWKQKKAGEGKFISRYMLNHLLKETDCRLPVYTVETSTQLWNTDLFSACISSRRKSDKTWLLYYFKYWRKQMFPLLFQEKLRTLLLLRETDLVPVMQI